MDNDFIPTNWKRSGNIISVIGVGGGGSNAVSYMYSQGIKDVDYIICNTDAQALEMSPVPRKLQLGKLTTKGLGAGTDYLVGRKAAQESIEDIAGLFEGNTEMVFITCGMGGGTGTGAAPVIAQIAREKNLLTVGVVTIPFRDEGEEALFRASEGVKELSRHVDSLLIIDNEKLYDLFGDLRVFSAFPKADEVLATAVKSIAEIITCGGFINVDFADVKKVMQNSGVAIMGIGEAAGADRAQKAIEEAFNSPLLNNLELKSVKNVLVNITSSSDEEYGVSMKELSQIMDYTKSYTGSVINFKRGIVKNDDMGENIRVTIIATGFNMTQLPVIDRPSARANIIEVRYDTFGERKRGIPTAPTNDLDINKHRLNGTPLLLTEDADQIAILESETAYSRREKIINQQINEQQ